MNTLFIRSLLSIILALVIFLFILAAFVFFGFDRSLETWNESKLEEIKAEIVRVLENPGTVSEANIDENIAVFIYGPDREPIFSNRGEGRRRAFPDNGEVQPVTVDGKLIGYYHIGRVDFQNDAANQRFISSISRVLWIGALVSCIISVAYAFFFSRSMAKPARIVAKGIRRIASGNLNEDIPETGAEEISHIAVAANDLKRQLLHEQKLRVQWAQDIAHDLRTPVSALKAQFEAMRDGVLPVNQKRIEQNIGEICRVEALINDLQELMQLETPELRLEKADVDLDALIRNVVMSFAFEAEQKNVNLESQPSHIVLSADEKLLHRALSNIMSNAVRHTNVGGTVELSSTSDDTRITIRTRNTGEAVPAEELNQVFDRLFRGNRARNTPGSGLGLTISRQIVELHGGSISMASNAEDGTTVEISLPR